MAFHSYYSGITRNRIQIRIIKTRTIWYYRLCCIPGSLRRWPHLLIKISSFLFVYCERYEIRLRNCCVIEKELLRFTYLSFSYSYLSSRILWFSVWDFFVWSWFYLGLWVLFCSYKWTQRLCWIFGVFIHPFSQVNHTAEEIAILGVRSLRRSRLLWFTT